MQMQVPIIKHCPFIVNQPSHVDRLWGHSVRKHDNQEESTQVTANSNEEFGSTILSRGERLKVWPTHNQGRFRTPRKQHQIKDPSKYERIMNDLYSYGGVPYTLVCTNSFDIILTYRPFCPFPITGPEYPDYTITQHKYLVSIIESRCRFSINVLIPFHYQKQTFPFPLLFTPPSSLLPISYPSPF